MTLEAMRIGLRYGIAAAGAVAAVAATLVLVPGAHAAITASSLVNPVSGKCLDASGAGTANGTRLVVSTCGGAASQKWNLKSNSTITGVPSGKCVDVRGNGTAN